MGIVTFIEQSELALMFVWAAALGAVFGVFYDLFRILRRAMRVVDRNPVALVLIFIEDIIFFTAAAAVSAIFFYKFNSGRIRLTGVIFIILGFSAYYFTLGKLVMLVADAVIGFIKSISMLILSFIRLLLSPFVRLANFVWLKLRRAARLLRLRIYTRVTLGSYRKLLSK